MTPALRIAGLTKRYGATMALDAVSLEVARGEIHAICGENGAGKSTLLGILSGKTRADAGSVELLERPLAIIHQELALVAELSVAENLFLGREPTRFGLVDFAAMYAAAAARLPFDPRAKVRTLRVAEQQLVEITRALMQDARILLLDEPTAALSKAESDALLAQVKALKAQGITCIYVSHRMDEVFAIADRITVLRDGKHVMTRDAHATNASEIVSAMIGRALRPAAPRARGAAGVLLLQVQDICVRSHGKRVLERIRFDVRAGEVVGLAGLMGAGRSELLLHLYGAWGERESGTVRRYGALGLVPEDRKQQGLFMQQDTEFHLRLMVDAEPPALLPPLDAPVRTLSGGNQQKVVLAKCLAPAPDLVLLDEPTRGVDVGAKAEIYAWIDALRAEGKGVLLASSELSEILALSDRVLVLSQGRIAKEFAAEGLTQQAVMEAALSHA